MTRSTCSIVVVSRVDGLSHDPAPPQHDDAIHDLEHVMDVVGDEDAGVAGVARVAHEAQHALGLRDTEVVGGLVEDDELALEVHRAGDGDRLALAAGERHDRSRGRHVLGDAHLAHELAGPRRP